jgi:hypothetical protein
MRGRRRYVFEIAMRRGSQWSVAAVGSGTFSRVPKATVRSIAERWIFEQAGQLRGGRLVILGKRKAPPTTFDASVRIRILDDRLRLLAAAYIGVDRRKGAVLPPGKDVTVGRDDYLSPAMVVSGRGRD